MSKLCARQLCWQKVKDNLSVVTFTFWYQKMILENCDLWDIWLEWFSYLVILFYKIMIKEISHLYLHLVIIFNEWSLKTLGERLFIKPKTSWLSLILTSRESLVIKAKTSWLSLTLTWRESLFIKLKKQLNIFNFNFTVKFVYKTKKTVEYL